MKVMRVLFLLACLALLIYGAAWEIHRVYALDDGQAEEVSGSAFTEGTAYDSYLLKDGRLYDVRSLQPESAQVRDCKT